MEYRGHTIVAFCTVAIQHVSESKVFRCLSGYDQQFIQCKSVLFCKETFDLTDARWSLWLKNANIIILC